MATKLLFGTMAKTLTIFTPAYNRAYTLHLGYEALLRQTSKDFEWLIIDDGSSDNTRELVESWIAENKIPIRYHYQENQGMHGAHNTAYRLINTELNTCIDSDDYMPDDAVEKIIAFWRKYGSKQVAGIVGLDADFDGKLIGTPFKENNVPIRLSHFYNQGGKGDKKYVYRSDIICNYPEYPIFQGEKYVSLGYKYELIEQDYPVLAMNEVLVNVEYRPDGSSLNMYRQYIKNPQGFAFIRKSSMQLAPTAKRRFMEAIHYVSSSLILKNKRFLQESPRKLLTLCAIPFGIAWYLYIQYKTRNLQ
ncbi:MAG: glycosyltransferase [Bacteroidaceae bacterium]|nr:glycosyltransferase [Bacteroidaceae bacterium]